MTALPQYRTEFPGRYEACTCIWLKRPLKATVTDHENRPGADVQDTRPQQRIIKSLTMIPYPHTAHPASRLTPGAGWLKTKNRIQQEQEGSGEN